MTSLWRWFSQKREIRFSTDTWGLHRTIKMCTWYQSSVSQGGRRQAPPQSSLWPPQASCCKGRPVFTRTSRHTQWEHSKWFSFNVWVSILLPSHMWNSHTDASEDLSEMTLFSNWLPATTCTQQSWINTRRGVNAPRDTLKMRDEWLILENNVKRIPTPISKSK